ncbi:MAG: hypothetical protein COB04_08945 [Gammaproteobacteria bacterium]|nr:MAG: hypothetical protein COB04_08945 [Gammaproteobacteria bacterium]
MYIGLLCVLLLMPILPNPSFGVPNQAQTPGTTTKALKQVKQRINALQKKLRKNKDQKTKAESELQTIESKMGVLFKKLTRINHQLRTSENKLAELDAKHQQLTQARALQKTKLANDLKATYSQGRKEYLKMLLNLEQPERLSRVLRYYDYVQSARFERIQSFNQTLNALQQTSLAQHQERGTLAQLKNDLEQQKTSLDSAQAQRRKTLAKAKQTIRNTDQALSSLNADQKRLQKLLNAVQNALADLPLGIGKVAFKQHKGKLLWPTSGTVKHRFGQRRAQGRLKWNGIVIQNRAGAPVQAIHGGRIIFSDWLRGYGLLIIIDHGDRYMSLYGHNQSLLKETGDWVNAGEQISSVGNSGGQNETGLYFEIRKNGKPTNPSRWLPKRRR